MTETKVIGSYQYRLSIYERIKKKIANTAKTPEEYERRIRALVKKLNI